MNVTKEWVAQQKAKASAPVTEGWKNGVLTVFVEGKPTHFKGKGHRFAVSQHTKDWRERTASRLFMRSSGWAPLGAGFILAGGFKTPWPWTAKAPKRIAFTVYTSGRGFDGPDNIRLVCSPCLDALGPRRPRAPGMGIIDDDKNPAHAITYDQIVKAPMPGIAIRIGLAR